MDNNFEHLFTGKGRRDGGNDWYDVGSIQVPITNNVEWRIAAAQGYNAYGDGQPWNNFVTPEGVRLSARQLPPHEHELYLNDQGLTYHLFSDGAWHITYTLDWPLDYRYTYQFGLEVYGDWVDIVNGQKQPKPDPQHAQICFGSDKFLNLNKMGNSVISSLITPSYGVVEPLSFTILTRFAKGGKGANGCFIKRIWLKQIETVNNGFVVCYDPLMSIPCRVQMVKTYPDAVGYLSRREMASGYEIVDFECE